MVRAEKRTLHLDLDADRNAALTSTLSIERGIRTTLSEVDNRLGGLPAKIMTLDHHGSTPQSKRHLEQYPRDDRALALFSRLHSPPLLAHRDFINQKRILVLDAWAAAGPITRSSSAENWIFRLSVDDTKAGAAVLNHAFAELSARTQHLLLEQTGWGRSNEEAIQSALALRGHAAAGVNWFNWGLQQGATRILLRQIRATEADVILLVANAAEGRSLIGAMNSLQEDQRLPVVNHWGITGGMSSDAIARDLSEGFHLCFIQTRFSFLDRARDPFGRAVFERTRQLFPETIKTPSDMKAPTGFIHAYDLTRILIAAISQAKLTGEIEKDRVRVHTALEDLKLPVRGLIKSDRRPFRAFNQAHPDAHEALGGDDLTFARFAKDGSAKLDQGES
ncbi:MAG: ABC transporter substrate-binding protein [bacterium]|nr:ABC transporter substrate-binding protein [bacterium]